VLEGSESVRDRRWRLLLPWGAAALVVLIALPTLGRRDLWLDEGFTVAGANQLPEGIVWRSFSMATHYLLMAGWSQLSLDPSWLRLPSLLFSAAAAGLATHLALRLFGREVARTTAVLLPLLCGTIVYAQEARSYALVGLLTVVTWYVIAVVLEDDRPPLWVAWGLAAALLVYSHPLAVTTLFAQGLVVLHRERSVTATLTRSRIGVLIVAISLVPMVVAMAKGYESVPDWIPPLGAESLEEVVTLLVGRFAPAQVLVTVALVLATLVVVRRRAEDPRTAVLLAWVWVPVLALVLISLTSPTVMGRYLIGILPGVAILLAVGLRELPRPRWRIAATLALVLLTIPGLVDHLRQPGPPWSQAIDIVAAGSSDPTRHGVFFPDAYNRPAFEVNAAGTDLWRRTRPVAPTHPWGELKRYHDDMSLDDLAREVAGLEVIWAVWQDHLLWAGIPSFEGTAVDLMASVGFCPGERHDLAEEIHVLRFEPCPSGGGG
jgi:hypothetical protein